MNMIYDLSGKVQNDPVICESMKMLNAQKPSEFHRTWTVSAVSTNACILYWFCELLLHYYRSIQASLNTRHSANSALRNRIRNSAFSINTPMNGESLMLSLRSGSLIIHLLRATGSTCICIWKYSNIDYSALKPMEAILLLAKQKVNENQTPIFTRQLRVNG